MDRIGEAVANVIFWPRVAVAGGLAMGPFALPALRSRWRAARRLRGNDPLNSPFSSGGGTVACTTIVILVA